jgi:predicted nucleic acid-binding protein
VRAYADTSFLVKLLATEPDSETVIAEYRRLGMPRLFFLPLHALETRNAIHHRAYHQRRSASPEERRQIAREKTAALSKLDQMLERRVFLAVSADWDAVLARSRALSDAYTERTGARTYDILHIAFALELECEVFLTCDERQAQVGRAEGLEIVAAA